MKDSEFLEILNLYLDREIGAEDAARLESEVTGNPERYRIYRQYCRMHKACALLGNHEPATVPAWERTEVLARRRRSWSAGIAVAGVLAAACVAVIVVIHSRTVVVPRMSSQPAAVAVVRPAAPVAPAAIDRGMQPALAVSTLSSLVDSGAAPAVKSPELNAQFAWMNRVQLAPIQVAPIETAMFQPAPVLIDADNRAIHAAQPAQSPVERASFQFQR